MSKRRLSPVRPPAQNFSPETSPLVNAYLSSTLEKTKKFSLKPRADSRSPCWSQGDTIVREECPSKNAAPTELGSPKIIINDHPGQANNESRLCVEAHGVEVGQYDIITNDHNNESWPYTRRALVNCPNDWEDPLPSSIAFHCDDDDDLIYSSCLPKQYQNNTPSGQHGGGHRENVMPVPEAPKTISEIFDNVIQCLLLHNDASSDISQFKRSESMPGRDRKRACIVNTAPNVKCMDEKGNREDYVKTDNVNSNKNIEDGDEDEASTKNASTCRPALCENVDDARGSDVTEGACACGQPSSTNRANDVKLPFEDIDLVEDDVDVDGTNCYHYDIRFDYDTFDASSTKNPMPLERARQVARQVISGIRSRSPTPTGVRLALENVIHAGSTFARKSKQAFLSASCFFPETVESHVLSSEDEQEEDEEKIEMIDFSNLLKKRLQNRRYEETNVDHQQRQRLVEDDEVGNASKAFNSLEKKLNGVEQLNSGERYQSDSTPPRQKMCPLPREIQESEALQLKSQADYSCTHDNEITLDNGLGGSDINKDVTLSPTSPIYVSGVSKKTSSPEVKQDNNMDNQIRDTKEVIDASNYTNDPEDCEAEAEIENMISALSPGRDIRNVLVEKILSNEEDDYDYENINVENGVEKIEFNEVISGDHSQQRSTGKRTALEQRETRLSSSRSDLPHEDVSESEDVPRKTQSLIASNEFDPQGRDITEMIALISDEVSLKRYPSLVDLTDIENEGELSVSRSCNSNGARLRGVELKDRQIDSRGVNRVKGHRNTPGSVGRENEPGVSNEEIEEEDREEERVDHGQLFVNNHDHGYDTDDDQRSSGLSSCEEVSSHSSSRKRTNSSSATTPPNSPKLGFDAESHNVGTMVSLFETTSILYATHSISKEEDLSLRAPKHDYERLLECNDVSDSVKNDADAGSSKAPEENNDKTSGVEDSRFCEFDNNIMGKESCKNTCLCQKHKGLSLGSKDVLLDSTEIEKKICNYDTIGQLVDLLEERDLGVNKDVDVLAETLPSPPSASLEGDDDYDDDDDDDDNNDDKFRGGEGFGRDVTQATTSRGLNRSKKKSGIDEINLDQLREALQNECHKIGDNGKSNDTITGTANTRVSMPATEDQEVDLDLDVDVTDEVLSKCPHTIDKDEKEGSILTDPSSVSKTDNGENSKSSECFIEIESGSEPFAALSAVPLLQSEVTEPTISDSLTGNVSDKCIIGQPPLEESKPSHYSADQSLVSNDNNIMTKKISVENTETEIIESEESPKQMTNDAGRASADIVSSKTSEDSVDNMNIMTNGDTKDSSASSVQQIKTNANGLNDDDSQCGFSSSFQISQIASGSETRSSILVQNKDKALVEKTAGKSQQQGNITWDLGDRSKERFSTRYRYDEDEDDDEDEDGDENDHVHDQCNSCHTNGKTGNYVDSERLICFETCSGHGSIRYHSGHCFGHMTQMPHTTAGSLHPPEAKSQGCVINRSILAETLDENIQDNDDNDNDKISDDIQKEVQTQGEMISTPPKFDINCATDVRRVSGTLGHQAIKGDVHSEQTASARSQSRRVPRRVYQNTGDTTRDYEEPIMTSMRNRRKERVRTSSSSSSSPQHYTAKPTIENRHGATSHNNYHIPLRPMQRSFSFGSPDHSPQAWVNYRHYSPRMMMNYNYGQFFSTPLSPPLPTALPPAPPLPLAAVPSASFSSSTSSANISYSNITQEITHKFESTSQVLEQVSQKIEENLASMARATAFVDRANVHLSYCDQLIARSTTTLEKSSKVSAKAKDQLDKVDKMLTAGRIGFSNH